MSNWVTRVTTLLTLSMLLTGCASFVVKVRDDVAGLNRLKVRRAQEASLAVIAEREQGALKAQQPLESGELLPPLFAQAQLQDAWKGSACSNQMGIHMNLTTVGRGPMGEGASSTLAKVRGAFTAADQSKQRTARVIETGLEGTFDRTTGFLSLHAIPKSTELTPDELEVELAIREHVKNQIFAIDQQLNSNPSASEKYKLMDDREKLQSDEKNRLKKFAEIAAAKAAAAKAELVPFTVELARDNDGKGWRGTIDGTAFQDCEAVLVSDHGLTTEKLPPITAQMILNKARSRGDLNVYWLNLAAKDAREQDYFSLAQLYERQGARSPEHYVRAFEFYKAINDRREDARVQAALSRMYANGLGTSPNRPEAERLNALATETHKKALAVCESPETIALLSQMAERARRKGIFLELIASWFTGMEIDTLATRVIKRMVGNVISIDQPFSCEIWARRIDPHINASLTPDYYYGYDQYGNYYEEDNAFEKLLKSAVGAAAQRLAQVRPVFTRVTVEPQGQQRYQLIWNDGLHRESQVLDLN